MAKTTATSKTPTKSASSSKTKAVTAKSVSAKPRPASAKAPVKTAAKVNKGAKTPLRTASKQKTTTEESQKTQDSHQLQLTSKSTPTHEDRQKMIQEAAYHIAEQDGFQHGQEHVYWIRAEEQVSKLLNDSSAQDIH